jgi:CHAT domain-containing protein
MLYRVPFALLRDKETRKYLFQSHPIAIAPSLQVLQHCKRRLDDLDKAPLKPEGCILAVGNASYESKLLPGTREELQHLHSSFPGRVKILEQEEATRARYLELVKEASDSQEQHVFAFIHLEVHGEWKDDKPLHMDYNINEGQKRNNTGSLKFAKPPQRTGESNRPGELVCPPLCTFKCSLSTLY